MIPITEQFLNLTRATSSLVIESVRAIPELTTYELRLLVTRLSLLLIPIWLFFLGLASLVVAAVLKLNQILDSTYDVSALSVGLALVTLSGLSFFLIYRRLSK